MSVYNTITDFERNYIPEPMSGCWLWLASSPNGRYGAMNWGGKRVLAHVLSYLLHKGALSDHDDVDHRCRNTFCVNPDHLEAVSQLVNTRRQPSALKTHCQHGHPYI